MKPIPKGPDGKTAAQLDREARQKICRHERRVVAFLAMLLAIAGAVIVLAVLDALTN